MKPPVPWGAFALFGIRDGMTMVTSFIMPKHISNFVQSQTNAVTPGNPLPGPCRFKILTAIHFVCSGVVVSVPADSSRSSPSTLHSIKLIRHSHGESSDIRRTSQTSIHQTGLLIFSSSSNLRFIDRCTCRSRNT